MNLNLSLMKMRGVESVERSEARPRNVMRQNDDWDQTESDDRDLEKMMNTDSTDDDAGEIIDTMMTAKMMLTRR